MPSTIHISISCRTHNVAFDGSIYGIPMDGDILMMYYRKDILQYYDIAIPTTWEQVNLAKLVTLRQFFLLRS